MSDRTYFAVLPREAIGKVIMGRVQNYYSNTRVMEIIQKQRIAYRYYYDLGLDWAGWGTPGTTNQMQRGGEEGELALIRINHARSLVRGQIAMISNAKFDRRPRAASDDYGALKATQSCRYALDHYTQSGGLEQRRLERIESASTMGVGITHYGFDPALGAEYGLNPATGRIEHTGDAFSHNVLSWDLICDPYKEWDFQDTITIHIPRTNRFKLKAKYPQFAGQIENSPTQSVVPYFTPVGNTSDAASGDETELYVTYVLPSPIPGLERGRTIVQLSEGTVLEDGILAGYTPKSTTQCFPIARVIEAPVMGSPFGYPSFWEYLGVQELYDNLQSVVATNQSTFGAQNVAIKSGVDPRPIQLAGGMSAIVCANPKEDIVPLQLTKSPAEIFPHMQDLRRNMELLSGQTSINRGEAQGDRQSGAMGALLSAESVKNASPYQTSDVEALKKESKIILRLLRANAKRPIKIGISERGRTPYESAITGHDLGDTDDCDIELANPIQQTSEGKILILQTMAQLKIPLKPEQAMEVFAYGRLEPVTDGATAQGMRIQLENQQIAKGLATRVLLSDNHLLHCIEHAKVMSDAGRDDPAVQAKFFEHVEEHYRNFFGTDPAQDRVVQPDIYRVQMLVLFGQQPPPPRAPPGLPPQPPGKPDVTVHATPDAPSDGQDAPPGAPPGQPGNGGQMPSFPTNPATGNKWTPGSHGGTNQPIPTA